MHPPPTIRIKLSSCWATRAPWRVGDVVLPYFGTHTAVKRTAMVKVILIGPIAVLIGMNTEDTSREKSS